MPDATPRPTTWTPDQLEQIGRAEELQLTSSTDDRTPPEYVTMWVVRAGDNLYVRSAGGPHRPWYGRATAAGGGRIRAGGLELEVTFGPVDDTAQDDIDVAYHGKYDRYGPGIVNSVVGPDAHKVTIRLAPRTDPN
jgi:hypothetical protein